MNWIRIDGYDTWRPGGSRDGMLEDCRLEGVYIPLDDGASCIRTDDGFSWCVTARGALYLLDRVVPGERVRLMFLCGNLADPESFKLELATGTLLGSFHSSLGELVRALKPFSLLGIGSEDAPAEARIKFHGHSMSYGEVRKAAAALRAAMDALRLP